MNDMDSTPRILPRYPYYVYTSYASCYVYSTSASTPRPCLRILVPRLPRVGNSWAIKDNVNVKLNSVDMQGAIYPASFIKDTSVSGMIYCEYNVGYALAIRSNEILRKHQRSAMYRL